MSKPVVVVKTVFCRDGFSQVLEAVADGQYPCSVLCGDGVGACEHDEAHCELCLKKFHAMNFTLSDPELQIAIELVLKRRTIGEPEKQRLLQLRPELQNWLLRVPGFRKALLQYGEPWVRALLLCDASGLGSDVPLLYSGCAQALRLYSAKELVRHRCDFACCPMARLRQLVLALPLPAEICGIIFSFICDD